MSWFHVLMRWIPHPHWWRYYDDDTYATPGTLDRCRECRLCAMSEFCHRVQPLSTGTRLP